MSGFTASACRSLAAGLSLLAAAAPGVTAQTKLQDPQLSVFQAFPAADAYQAIVRTIDPAARRRIEERLPFAVHFNELGEHTIYVALRDRVPLGMVYVLCEEETFGLMEVRWAITLDMQLTGFEFQRARSRHRETVESSEFTRLLHGKNVAGLARMMKADGQLTPEVRGVPEGAEELASALTRSAMKALIVVDEVWVTEVVKLHDLAVGTRAFPTAVRFTRIWPLGPQVEEAPSRERAARIDYAIRAIGRDSLPIGVIAQTRPATAAHELAWTIDEAGIVLGVHAGPDAPPLLRSDCLAAVGRPLEEVARAGGRIASCARALQQLLQPSPRPAK